MKKIFIFIFFLLCAVSTCVIGCKNIEGPFDEQECILVGTLVAKDMPITDAMGDPGVGLWIHTANDSYLVNDANDNSWPIDICVGEITACTGDSIKAYGTSTSYQDYKQQVYHRITLDSIRLLKSREERIEIIDEEFVIRGELYFNSMNDVSISHYSLKRSCYTFISGTWCIQIAGEEFCVHGGNERDTVEAKGTLYRCCDDWGWMIYEIDVKEIRKL